MTPDIQEQLKAQQERLDAIWRSVEKTRKMFLVTMWATIITFVLPLIIMLFVLPYFIHTLTSSYSGLL